MSEVPRLGTDLYRGTAASYDRFRPPYPVALFDDLRRRVRLRGRERVMDLACGTGQIALPLAGHVAEVVAVDQEAETIAFGRAKADALGATNIVWVTGSAETVGVDGLFELVAVGNAFHRLDRLAVARRIRSWLAPGGAVCLLWADSPSQGEQRWQSVLEELFVEWMTKVGTTDRIPAGWRAHLQEEPHDQVLRLAGLDYVGKFAFRSETIWTVETLIGFAYSTSILNRNALGDKASDFERDLAERLGPTTGNGKFRQSVGYAYELARR